MSLPILPQTIFETKFLLQGPQTCRWEIAGSNFSCKSVHGERVKNRLLTCNANDYSNAIALHFINKNALCKKIKANQPAVSTGLSNSPNNIQVTSIHEEFKLPTTLSVLTARRKGRWAVHKTMYGRDEYQGRKLVSHGGYLHFPSKVTFISENH